MEGRDSAEGKHIKHIKIAAGIRNHSFMVKVSGIHIVHIYLSDYIGMVQLQVHEHVETLSLSDSLKLFRR